MLEVFSITALVRSGNRWQQMTVDKVDLSYLLLLSLPSSPVSSRLSLIQVPLPLKILISIQEKQTFLKNTLSLNTHVEHRQTHSFSYPDTDNHSYSPRHDNRTYSLCWFTLNHSSMSLGQVFPAAVTELHCLCLLSNNKQDYSWVLLFSMEWYAAECWCAILQLHQLGLWLEIYVLVKEISLQHMCFSVALPSVFFL